MRATRQVSFWGKPVADVKHHLIDEGSDGIERDQKLAVAIFQYLHDLAELRSAVVRDVGNYEKVFWLRAVRDKAGCESRCFRQPVIDAQPDAELDAEASADDPWLVVRKWDEPKVPEWPEELRDWISPGTGTDADSTPRLLDRIPRATSHDSQPGVGSSASDPGDLAADDSRHFELLENHPEVVRLFDDHVRSAWNPWAQQHADWVAFQKDVYSPIFSIHRELQRLGEEFELVLGVGCLSWRVGNATVRRHLITAQVSLEFADGVFTLHPSADGAKLSLEVNMLDPTEHPAGDQLEAVNAAIVSAEDDPWRFDAIDRALQGFARALAPDGAYEPDLYEAVPAKSSPQVSFAPALLLRRRTSRGLLATFKAIIEQLKSGVKAPEGVRRLTRAGGSRSGGEGRGSASGVSGAAASAPRIYFPLPANEDQRQIVERLDDRHGVLVQGPPGTGKSHTIANLICHLLATGNRVLVTAQTPRALQVLRAKLPAEMQELCLSVLGNDKVSQEHIESSVRTITSKLDSWNSEQSQTAIQRADAHLDRLSRRESELERDLRTFREAELHSHTVADGAYSGTAQEIAKRVRDDAVRFGWLSDAVQHDAGTPFHSEMLTAYRDGLIFADSERAAELKLRRPTKGEELPSDDTLVQLLENWDRLQQRLHAPTDADEPLERQSDESLRRAFAAVRSLYTAAQQLPISANGWLAAALTDVLRGTASGWERLRSDTVAVVVAHGESAKRCGQFVVRLPASRPEDVLLADVTDLLEHVRRGGGFGLWIFRPEVVRRTRHIWTEAIVDGRPCKTAEALSSLKEYLECSAAITRGWAMWEGKAAPASRSVDRRAQELDEVAVLLARVTELRALADAAAAELAALGLSDPPPLHDLRAVAAWLAQAERVIVRRDLAVLGTQLDTRARALRSLAEKADSHPVCARISVSLERRDVVALRVALAEYESLNRDGVRLADWEILRNQVRSALPNLAEAISLARSDPEWNSRIAQFDAAWKWARANAWLIKFTNAAHAQAAERELRLVKEEMGQRLAEASAARAWESCLSGMSEAHRQHLAAWQQAVKKIGKGTGKQAGRWRSTAQMHMDQCRSAIPAWVMPLYRVFETIQPKPKMFDVVIVDEASQCGPDSLALFYLAKKIIVVGDDKQISPSHVGVDKEQARALLRRHLDGIDLADTFDIDSSLFDHGHVRLGKRVTLREHFRCMPEIIRFSNDLCYNGALVPLRQYSSNRLRPFVAQFIADGKRTGATQSAKNEREAEALVDAVVACCKDPMYADKTMGVISLLGEAQAKLIERLLLRRIGAEEIERRRIVCGDAYSFQGDERHVVFLSLVISPKSEDSRGFAALTKPSDVQRFNVAASRAQDQLWLFHSVMPEDISNHECVRHRLLTYFYDPAKHAAASVGVDLAVLRRQANESDRSGDPPAPFDSWFEVDVYLQIVARGFRVLPQYKAGRKRIDLVVEGKARLAVECDGDRYHTDENLQEDMDRQRQLERANWVFWRVRGSVYYRDPEAALRPLWERLAQLEIEPMPAIDGSGSAEGYLPNLPPRSAAAPAAPLDEDDATEALVEQLEGSVERD